MPGFAEVYVEFKPSSQGGRRSAVWLNEDAVGRYMPHLRIHAADSEYLGVEFVDGPDWMIAPGDGTSATVRFMYELKVSYDALSVGATFEICEGGLVVGSG